MASPYGGIDLGGEDESGDKKIPTKSEVKQKKKADSKSHEFGSRYGAVDLGLPKIDDDEDAEPDGMDADAYRMDGDPYKGIGDAYGTDGDNYGSILDPNQAEGGHSSRYGAQDAPEDLEEKRMLERSKRKKETKYEKSLKTQGLRSIFENRRKIIDMKDWSKSFLEAEDLPENNVEEVLRKYRTLTKLSTDFIEIAKAYGRTAISEYFLKDKARTVKKHKLGGVAGGDKYLVRGILFKLAVDPAMGSHGWVYGGKKENFEYAAKAAGHELKGAINMYKYHVKKIRVPMQALVDFHGYRIVAMPLLPLKKMIYGSNDAGKTIHRSDEDFNQIMKEIAEDLHVAGHYIVDKDGVPNMLHAAGDIEGHLGKDEKYYLLDLARTFPPESVWDTPHLSRPLQAVFFRMLRPEFLQFLKEDRQPPLGPLSCDALTRWGQTYTDRHKHNERLREATRILCNEVIPAFAEEFAKRPVERLKAIHVSEELHRKGINVRHMGLLRHLIKADTPSADQARRTLLVAMCSRTLKNLLRREMRMELARHKKTQPSEHESRGMIVDFLNLVTRAHQTQQTYDFWGTEIPFELKVRFGPKAISIEEENNLFGAVRNDIVKIVKYIVDSTGVQLTTTCLETLESSGAGYEFVSVDLSALAVRIKHMSVIDYATAKVLSQEAYKDTGVGGDRLLSLAMESFYKTLQSDPLNTNCLREAQITRMRIAARENEKKKKDKFWAAADESLFEACKLADKAKDLDDVMNVVREILSTWKARLKQEECPEEYQKSGGASTSDRVHAIVRFVTEVEKVDNSGSNLTISLCSFLSTCKDESLWKVMHELLYQTTVKKQKTELKTAKDTLDAWTLTVKQLEGAALEKKLVWNLIEAIKKNKHSELKAALSNFLAALQMPEFWIQACHISKDLLDELKEEKYEELYKDTPWKLKRTDKKISDEEAKQIAEVIKFFSPLESLNLNGCQMKDTHIRQIAEACIHLPKGTRFETLEYKSKIPVQRLRQNLETKLKYSRATSQDVVWLFSLLHHNTSVKEIELDSTNLNVLEVKAICECLSVHAFESLKFINCNMRDPELKLLAEALSKLSTLESLSLSGNVFTDASGKLLGELKTLQELDLSKCFNVTDKTIEAIAKSCKSLTSLNLRHCSKVSSDGVSSLGLGCHGLKTLILEECSLVKDLAIQELADGCPDLVHLNIRNCKKVSGIAITHLAKKCTKLRHINLCFCDYITDQSISVLAANCKDLEYINLGHCKKLNDTSIGQIGTNCPNIQELNLSVCEKITDESIIKIAKGCPQLRKLNLAVCGNITDASISQISQSCQDLEELVVPCCDKVTDNSIQLLSRCKNLSRLNVYACKKVTDKSIGEIAKNCTNLTHLDVFWCAEVSDDVIEELKAANPACEVDR